MPDDHQFRGNTLARSKESSRRRPSSSSSSSSDRPRRGEDRSLLQILAALFGLAFLLAGIGGFIPGLTSNYDELSLLGTDSNAKLLGLFRVSVLHNLVHALFGVGLLAAARASWSKLYLLGGGLAYLGVVAYGFIVDQSSDANFLPVNDADNLLHVGLSLGLVGAGLVGLAVERRTALRG
jgi:hypothetical protein